MAEPEPVDPYATIDRALWLFSAFRTGGALPPSQNKWLEDELRSLSTSDDPVQYMASMGALIGAFLQLLSTFLDGWALASGQDAEALLAVTRRINEMNQSSQGGED
jgi:hypothetical protein